MIKNYLEIFHPDELLELTEDDTIIDLDLCGTDYDKLTFPNWIKEISIVDYQYKLDNLPEKLEYLSIINNHNNLLDELPNNLKTLTIGTIGGNNGSIPNLDKLPDNLEKLTIHRKIEQKLSKLPKNLKELVITESHKHKLENLPENLSKLFICYPYHYDLDSLPKNLKELYIKKDYQLSLDNLPNLKKLQLFGNINYPKDGLPLSLKKLSIKYNECMINNLPKKLKRLELYVSDEYDLNLINFPNTITYLTIIGKVKNKLHNFPESLNNLRLMHYNHELNSLPDNLEILQLDNCNQPLDSLPAQLKILTFGFRDIHRQKYNLDFLPINLKALILSSNINVPINNLPNSIDLLSLGREFNQIITNLPNNIKYIYISKGNPNNKKIVENIKKISNEVEIIVSNLMTNQILDKYLDKNNIM